MIKCQNCGCENSDDARFCNSCGTKIERNERTYTCSKCGKKILGEKQFCDSCGSKLIYSTGENEAFAIPSKENENKPVTEKPVTSVKTNGKNVFEIIARNIFAGTLILVCLLAIISIFGDVVSALLTSSSGATTSDSIGFTYWFKDGWDAFKATTSNATKTLFIFNFISFLVGFTFVLTFGSIAIAKLIISIVKQQKFTNKNLVMLTLAGPLQYFILSLCANYGCVTSGGEKLDYIYGVGAATLIVAISFYIVAMLFRKVANGIINKNLNIASVILTGASGILLFVLALTSFNSFVKYTQQTLFSGKNIIYESIMPIMSTIDQGTYQPITTSLVVICFALTLILIMLSVWSFFNFDNPRGVVVLSSVLIVFSLTLLILSKFAGANYYADLQGGSKETYAQVLKMTQAGPSTISFFVLSILSLGTGGIANSIVSKAKVAA